MTKRIIKFRAWISKDCRRGYKTEVMWNDEQVKSELISDMKFPSLFWNGNGIYPMQFTGLLDKNGKEIYEGDILNPHELKRSRRCIVEYMNGGFLPFTYDGESSEYVDSEKVEIIGNIYENKNLLK